MSPPLPAPVPAPADFRRCVLPRLQRPVLRLGLAPNYGLDSAGIHAALRDRGMQYVFWTPTMRKATGPLREALAADRDRLVIATGPTTAFWGGNIRAYVEGALRTLRIDQLDVLQMHWLGVTSWWTDGTVQAMVRLREEGKVRALGVSIHDRKRAGELVKDSPLDLLMIRYNAAHPGAEREIFPFNPPGDQHRAITAYTATSWRRLLKAPRGWPGPPATAAQCYRFALSSPEVDVVLTGPKSLAELDQNLAALEAGPLDAEEMAWMRSFGTAVHG